MTDRDAWAWVGDEFTAEARPLEVRPEKRARRRQEKPAGALPYQIVLGGRPIQLSLTEYRLILFLANRPYYAFSREQIIAGVGPSEDGQLLATEEIGELIQSLRDKLGFFRDFIQTVPHIGYRFKP